MKFYSTPATSSAVILAPRAESNPIRDQYSETLANGSIAGSHRALLDERLGGLVIADGRRA
jgi:hypothetical protein